MKNLTTPRTLAECSFVTGHRMAQIERRASGAITMLVVVVLAVLGALLLVHYLTPCEAGTLCSVVPMLRCNADACRQGEIPCPCPERCGVPEDDKLPGDGEWAEVGFGLLIASGIVTAAILIKVFA